MRQAGCDNTSIVAWCHEEDPALPCYSNKVGTPANFIFELGPGEPTRYGVTNCNGFYQTADPDYWPTWGSFDLMMGRDGPPGSGGMCDRGHTYGQRSPS